MSPLPSDERRALLELARRAIVEAVHGRPLPETAPAAAERTPCGVFVSLHQHGQLRGCIGQLESPDPLAVAVTRCAASAALDDPRFDPVRAEEIPGLAIEISVLSPPAPITLEQIEVGKHGLLVARTRLRGVLLPQVAVEQHWPALRFLEETCRKAGLDRDAWKDPGTKVLGFTAEVFSEREFQGEGQK